MNIIISNAAGQPIYEQISSQVKQMILSGALREGEALPSMRVLAKELRVSLITTKRAYEELERDGLLTTVAGKGCFVAKLNLAQVREAHLLRVEEHFTEAVQLAKGAGISRSELAELLETICEGEGL